MGTILSVGQFWSHVTTLCHMYNMRVTSGPRSQAWNRSVGGVSTSFHLCGLGADVAPYDPAVQVGLKELAERMGILAIAEGDHWHLQPKE